MITFVVGAGASSDLGLPMGGQLKEEIASILRDEEKQKFAYLRSALHSYKQTGNNQEARQIAEDALRRATGYADAIETNLSIDTFLDQHRHDEDLVTIGKFLIYWLLSDAECNSSIGRGIKIRRDLIRGSKDHFVPQLFQLMIKGQTIDTLPEAFSRINFITFNYDRCIERLLETLLLTNFAELDQAAAADIISNASFTHVYGSLGNYFSEPDRNFSRRPDQGGAFLNPHLEMQKGAEDIRLFTESVATDLKSEIAEITNRSDAIVFLGFGYEQQNLRIFSEHTKAIEVLGTVYGNSEPNIAEIQDDLSEIFQAYQRVQLASTKCLEFVQDYSRTITRHLAS